MLSDDNESQKLVEDTQYVIYTAGVNMVDIRYLNGIDINRTICNNVIKIYENFGIEALRTILLKEFLLESNIRIKVMNEKLLKHHLRISLGTQKQNRIAIDAIKEFAVKYAKTMV